MILIKLLKLFLMGQISNCQILTQTKFVQSSSDDDAEEEPAVRASIIKSNLSRSHSSSSKENLNPNKIPGIIRKKMAFEKPSSEWLHDDS